MKTVLITENTDASIGLRLAGVQTVCKHRPQSLERELNNVIAQDDTAILLITPGVEQLCPETVSQIRRLGKPLLVTVPDSEKGFDNTGIISEYVQNAIGIKLD